MGAWSGILSADVVVVVVVSSPPTPRRPLQTELVGIVGRSRKGKVIITYYLHRL